MTEALLIPLGGALNRWRGGWTPFPFLSWPHQLRRLALATTTAGYASILLPLTVLQVLGLAGLMWLGWALASWGSYMSLDREPVKPDNEWSRFLLSWLPRSSWAHNALGLAIQGLTVTMPAGLLLLWQAGPWPVYALAGSAMPLLYEAGWRLHRQGAVAGELLFGCLLWSALWAQASLASVDILG